MSDFQDEVLQLLNDMPESIAKMSDKQMLACILYKLYELSKQLKNLKGKDHA